MIAIISISVAALIVALLVFRTELGTKVSKLRTGHFRDDKRVVGLMYVFLFILALPAFALLLVFLVITSPVSAAIYLMDEWGWL